MRPKGVLRKLHWVAMRPFHGPNDPDPSADSESWLRSLGVEIGEAVTFLGRPIASLEPNSTISIGSRSLLISDPSSTALGVASPIVLRTLRPGATIRIGSDVGISGASICAITSVTIGDRVLLGADVLIADTDFHPVDAVPRRHSPIPEPLPDDRVTVEDDVFIGARSIILKGSSIGKGSVIGAGSVVTGSIPSGVVAAGNPCRVIRPLQP